jgi:hypothetical protein
MRLRLGSSSFVAVLALSGVLPACGGSSSKSEPPPAVPEEQRGVLATIDDLQGAIKRGDGEGICGRIFTPELARSVESASKTSCPKEVSRELFTDNADLSVGRDLQVKGNRATATVKDQTGKVSRLALVNQDNQWRIDSVKPESQGSTGG